MVQLRQKKCVPCEGGAPPLHSDKVRSMLKELHVEWIVLENKRIERLFTFKDFKRAMIFVTTVADIAEEERHHPDIHIHYNQVTIILWTHAIQGLSENDFIVASKIDAVEL